MMVMVVVAMMMVGTRARRTRQPKRGCQAEQ